jgi:serine protease inhibitor ecotin
MQKGKALTRNSHHDLCDHRIIVDFLQQPLPIVVYALKGYEVRFRIWRASEKSTKAEKSSV